MDGHHLCLDPGQVERYPHSPRARGPEVGVQLRLGLPTVPTRIDLEKATNPFLRTSDPLIRAHLAMTDATDAEVFAEIRRRKDNF